MNQRWWNEHLTPALSPSAPPTPPTRRGGNVRRDLANLALTSARLIWSFKKVSNSCLPLPAGEGLRVRENGPSNLRAMQFLVTLQIKTAAQQGCAAVERTRKKIQFA